MWIKICGMTSALAVQAAADARADAIGFVFADSPRRVTPAQAQELARCVRGRLRCVAVTHHPTPSAVQEILAVFDPDVLQTDLADLPGLQLPATLELLPVLRDDAPAPDTPPPRLLFEGARSGRGRAPDWHAARSLARRSELVLAGGLNPHNVAAAIAAVQPFGVDVSSGVEERPGVKSPAAIAQFVAAARAAALPARAPQELAP